MKKILAILLIFSILISASCTKESNETDEPIIVDTDTEAEVTDDKESEQEEQPQAPVTEDDKKTEINSDSTEKEDTVEVLEKTPEKEHEQKTEQTPEKESETSSEESDKKEPEQSTTVDGDSEKISDDFKYSVLDDGIIISSYSGTEKDVVIPSVIDGKPVVRIFSCAFSTLPIVSVTIPDTVKIIEMLAFSNCDSLVDVSFGKGVTYIGEKAFYDCDALKKLTLPENLTELSLKTFSNCDSLEEVFIPKTLENWGQSAFISNNKLQTIVFEDGIKTIGTQGRGYAFGNCDGLKTVTLPASVQSIADSSFAECKSLASVYFNGDAPIELGDNIFKSTASDVSELVLYYKPSTKGWDTTELKDEYTLQTY